MDGNRVSELVLASREIHHAATQLQDARLLKTSVVIAGAGLEFSCTGENVVEQGWSVLDPASLKCEQPLPDLKEGELELVGVDTEQKFTKPPPRFSEARLVTEMKKRGIGRPSTYVQIISKLKSRSCL